MPTQTLSQIWHSHLSMMACLPLDLKTVWYVSTFIFFLCSLFATIHMIMTLFQVKLWHIPENGLQESLSDPECVFSHKQRRVETVSFHPTADCLLSTTSFTTLTLWDVAAQKEIFCKLTFNFYNFLFIQSAHSCYTHIKLNLT